MNNSKNYSPNEKIKAWIDKLKKYRELSIKLLEIVKLREYSLEELNIDKFVEKTKEKEKLLSSLNQLSNEIIAYKEKYQIELTDEQINKIKTLQNEINQNVESALEKSKEQEKQVEQLQGFSKEDIQNLNKKQAEKTVKDVYSKKKKEGLNNTNNIGSRFDKKN